MNAGGPLNAQNEPEETTKKEKKSEALNIRGRVDFGQLEIPSGDPNGLCCALHSLFALDGGVLESRQVPHVDSDPASCITVALTLRETLTANG